MTSASSAGTVEATSNCSGDDCASSNGGHAKNDADDTVDRGADTLPDPNDLRLAANGAYAANKLDEALPIYSLAVEVARKRMEQQQQSCTDLVIHLCNRSACLYKMEMYDEACSDAAEAVALSKETNSKAFFRLARAQISMKDYPSAMETIKKATTLCEDQLKQQQPPPPEDDGGSNDKSSNPILLQKQEFDKLLAIALRKQKESAANPETSPQDIASIKLEPRTPSIKEFNRTTKSSEAYNPLGEGNFSSVVVCQHKITNETFALKIIEKEECKKLAKRQHPNVYNEVAMERRILTQNRLPYHVNVVQAYHAMQGKQYFCRAESIHAYHGYLYS